MVAIGGRQTVPAPRSRRAPGLRRGSRVGDGRPVRRRRVGRALDDRGRRSDAWPRPAGIASWSYEQPQGPSAAQPAQQNARPTWKVG